MKRPTRAHRHLIPILAFQLLNVLSPTASAQSDARAATARLRAQLVDVQSGQAVASAQLLLLRSADTLVRGRSDSQGRFTVSGAYGERFTLEIRRFGFLPVTLHWTPYAGDTAVVITMTALPRALAAVAVVDRASTSARLSAFDSRAAARAGGTYILRQQIDAWHPHRTSDLMRRVLGIKLIDSSGTMLAASTRGEKVDLMASNAVRSWGPCVMRVGLDGHVKEWGFPMDAVDPDQIHGIEVFNGPASIPSEFAGLRKDSFCGLVMIWTRSGY